VTSPSSQLRLHSHGLQEKRSQLGNGPLLVGSEARICLIKDCQERDRAHCGASVALQLVYQLSLALNTRFAPNDVPARLRMMICGQRSIHISKWSGVATAQRAVSSGISGPVQELRNRKSEKEEEETGGLWIRREREQDKRRRLTAPTSECLHKGFLSTRQIWRVLDWPNLFRSSVNYNVRTALTGARDSPSAP
jgi:hypothetical protein